MAYFDRPTSDYFNSLWAEKLHPLRDRHEEEDNKITWSVEPANRFNRHYREQERFAKELIDSRIQAFMETCQYVNKYPNETEVREFYDELCTIATNLSKNLPPYYKGPLSNVPLSLIEKCEEQLNRELLQYVGIALAPVHRLMNEGKLSAGQSLETPEFNQSGYRLGRYILKSKGAKKMSEGIGDALREGFEALFEISAQTIIVHENFNTPEASSHEVKGLKNTADENPRQVVFQFLDPLDIHIGSVLQVKGSRDYWRVIDTEDMVEEGTFINFETRVEKINLAGQPTRPSPKGGTTYKTEIHLRDSVIGILNTGEIKDVESISVNASLVAEAGHAEMAKALKELTEAVAASRELSADDRAYVLENLEELSRQAALPPETRAKAGVIRSVVAGVGATLSAAGGLAEVWSTWGAVISSYFGF